MVNHFEIDVIFQDIEHQLQENIYHNILVIVFRKSSLNLEVSKVLSKLITGSFCGIAQP